MVGFATRQGLKLAAADIRVVADASNGSYEMGTEGMDGYSDKALARVWKPSRFSWWFTSLTLRFPDMEPLAQKMQLAELDYIRGLRAAQTTLAENDVGLPFG